MTKYVVDTNVILGNPDILESYDVVIPSIVLREIESLELKKGNKQLQFEIRNIKRILFKIIEEKKGEIFTIDEQESGLDGYSDGYADNKIIKFAKDNNFGIITNDVLMILKARELNIEIISPMFNKKENSEYQGISDFYINDSSNEIEELLAQIELNIGGINNYEFFTDNYKFYENQYLIFWDKERPSYKIDKDGNEVISGYKEVGIYKYDGRNMQRVSSKGSKIISKFDEISPRNTRQRCAIDMLKDEKTKIKALFGTFGAGKDYLLLGQALAMVQDPTCEIDKIVWVRNNIEVKDSNPIGFLPNNLEDKLMPFLMPLVDHLGGEQLELQRLMEDGKLEVQHLGFIRGRDIKNAIIYVTEVQSNTLEHIQLLIGRVGEGSQIWLNGDDQQTDSAKFELNNGVRALKKLVGESLYGQVTLDKTERSEVARLSELLNQE